MDEKEIQEVLEAIQVLFSEYEMHILLLYLLRDFCDDNSKKIIEVLKDWKEIIVYSI